MSGIYKSAAGGACLALILLVGMLSGTGCAAPQAVSGLASSAGTAEMAAGWEPIPEGSDNAALSTAAAGTTAAADSAQGEAEVAQADTAGSGENEDPIIVLDPGHSSVISGRKEPIWPGASYEKLADSVGTHGEASGLMEYQLTLMVCQKVRTALEEKGYTVLLTREDSSEPLDCSARAEIANEAGAAAFIRVHADGSDSAADHGAMAICISDKNPNTGDLYEEDWHLSSVLLSEYIKATGRKDRGIWVTDTMIGSNWSRVPTTMLELGFMTNREEDLWMASEEGQEQIVTGMVNGICAYLEE